MEHSLEEKLAAIKMVEEGCVANICNQLMRAWFQEK